MKLPRALTILTTVGLIVFIGLLINDLLRFKQLLKQNGQKISQVPDIRTIPPEYRIPPAPEFDPNALEKKCEYVQVIQEETNNSNPLDKIQKNIGYQNNKVGLYIYAEVEEFAEMAGEMVNSNGGDWGYVLIPYNVRDYDEGRWNNLFDRLSKQHLIPIIQLWDLDLDNNKKDKEIEKSAQFLNSLMWPVKNRYISAYNETNDKNFWKGQIDPEGYAEILNKTISTFKKLNENFFMMNGAFNASARTGRDFLDEEEYLIKMDRAVPGIFEKLDGWASHSYPQPNFSGDKNGRGRDSVRAYEWELSLLSKHFNVQDLPVFITETGWTHKESETDLEGLSVLYRRKSTYQLNQYQAADNIKYAFENVWLPDDRVVAITPFTVRYNPPYDHFSWITVNNSPYPQFTAIKSIEKIKGKPPIVRYYKSKEIKCQ